MSRTKPFGAWGYGVSGACFLEVGVWGLGLWSLGRSGPGFRALH